MPRRRRPSKRAQHVAKHTASHATKHTPSHTKHTPKQLARMQKMLGNMPAEQKQQFAFDEVALYSTSSPTLSRTIALEMLNYVYRKTGRWRADITVLDAFACVGGFATVFAKIFRHVYAVEIDAIRYAMLNKNLTTCGAGNRVTTIHGSCQDYLRRTDASIAFFDPPWGGPGYKTKPIGTLRICIDETPFEQLILDCTAQYAVVKLPCNYDINHFIKTIGYWRVVKQRVYTEHKCMIVYLDMYSLRR